MNTTAIFRRNVAARALTAALALLALLLASVGLAAAPLHAAVHSTRHDPS